MIVDFHGIKCRFGRYRVNGEDKPVLTPVSSVPGEQLIQYGFEDPTNGLWCHFLTDDEMKKLFPEQS